MLVAVVDLSRLSDTEFESLARDVLGAHLGLFVESFPQGKDGGIDLRWQLPDRRIGVGQCKRDRERDFAGLWRSLHAEVPKLALIAPHEYRVITSVDLTIGQKAKITDLFAPWMPGTDHVLGARDIASLLSLHPEVERRHLKLQLTTGTQLFANLNAEVVNRTRMLRRRIEATRRTYVPTGALLEAERVLEQHRVCVLSGVPGIGKTSLGHMLVGALVEDGFEPVDVSEDIGEAATMLRDGVRQVFFYDDFLGELAFREQPAKNEDRRIAEFVALVHDTPATRLVLTTREYVLRDALADSERLHRAFAAGREFVVRIEQPTLHESGLILDRHLRRHNDAHSPGTPELEGRLTELAGHPNFNPRVIAEVCANYASSDTGPQFADRLSQALDRPDMLWQASFDKLTDVERCVLFALATLRQYADYDRYDLLVETCARFSGGITERVVRRALKTLDGTFVFTDRPESQYAERWEVGFANPAVREFTLRQLREDRVLLRHLFAAASDVGQLSAIVRDQANVWSATGTRAHTAGTLATVRAEFIATLQNLVETDPGNALDAFQLWSFLPIEWAPPPSWTAAYIHDVHEKLSRMDAIGGHSGNCAGLDLILTWLATWSLHRDLHALVDSRIDQGILDFDASDWMQFCEHHDAFHQRDDTWRDKHAIISRSISAELARTTHMESLTYIERFAAPFVDQSEIDAAYRRCQQHPHQ